MKGLGSVPSSTVDAGVLKYLDKSFKFSVIGSCLLSISRDYSSLHRVSKYIKTDA